MNTIEHLAEILREESNLRVTIEMTCAVIHLPHGYWAIGNCNETWGADFYPFKAHDESTCLASLDLGVPSGQMGFTSLRSVANRFLAVLNLLP